MPPRKAHRFAMCCDGSYNSMDFLRTFYNVMIIFGAQSVSFHQPLWKKMLKCQRYTSSYLFSLDMEDANGLIQGSPTLNWTTLLIFLCEMRQVIDATGMQSFLCLLDFVETHDTNMKESIDDITKQICTEGAKGVKCYAFRLYERLAATTCQRALTSE